MATDPEHTFAEGVLISGENIDDYTAGADISAREPVKLTGDYTVSPCNATDEAVGFAAYDVASGEEVAVIKDGCEAKVKAGAALSAGVAVTPDGSGGVQQAANTDFTNSVPADPAIAVTNQSAGASGDLLDVTVRSAEGVRS